MNGCPQIRGRIVAAGLALGCLLLAQSSFADPPKAVAATSIVMPPFAVLGKPVSSFGLSLRVLRSEATQRALGMTITDVEPGSDAQRKGIAAGTVILSIDGSDVRQFHASFASGSELNEKLLQRRPGDEVILEIMPPGASKPRTVTLVEAQRNDPTADVRPLNAKRVGLPGARF